MLHGMMGFLVIIPVTILLTISFFVLFGIKKSEGNGLKGFGWVVAVLLWFSAAVLFTSGMVVMAKGGPMMMQKGMMMNMMNWDKEKMDAWQKMMESMKTGTPPKK